MNIDPATQLRDMIRDYQAAAGFPSIRSIARMAGTSHTTVARFLAGHRIPADWDTTAAIAAAIGVTDALDLAMLEALYRRATAAPAATAPPTTREVLAGLERDVAGLKADMARLVKHFGLDAVEQPPGGPPD